MTNQGWSRGSWSDDPHDAVTNVHAVRADADAPYADDPVPRPNPQPGSYAGQPYPYESYGYQPAEGSGGPGRQDLPAWTAELAWHRNGGPASGSTPWPQGPSQPGAWQQPTWAPQQHPMNGGAPFAGPYGPPPGGYDPFTGEPLSDRSRVVAGVLQLFLGCFGVGRFYIGDSRTGAAQLILTVVGFMTLIILIGFPIIFAVGIWALIDAIMMFTGAVRDPYGRKLS